jgi:hypothetical protein
MHFSRADFALWAAGFTVQILLLLVLAVRRHARTFPAFTTLMAANVLNTIVLYEVGLHGSKHTYFVAYFAFAVLDLFLQLAVTYELARRVFCPTGTWARDIRNGFLVLVLLSLAVALGLACLPSPPEKTVLGMLLDRGNLFSSALQCELFVGMIAFSSTANLPWNTHVARIAQGLGFYSLIGLLTEAGHNILTRNTRDFQSLTYFRMSIYLLCVSYWIVMLWLPAPAPQELPEEAQRQLFTLQRRVEYDLRKLRAFKR